MGQPSSGGVAHAVKDGFARAVSAPAILAGTLALTFVFALSRAWVPQFVVFEQSMAITWLSPFGGTMYLPQSMPPTWLVVWTFLAGGILDRYARNRPTRGRGFFGACGAHFPAMLRLGLAEWAIWIAAARFDVPGYRYVPMTAGLAAGVVFLYARVRLVVEDRRSAFGALLAGARFIRRNPVTLPMFLLFAGAIWGSTRLWTDRVASAFDQGSGFSFGTGELVVALLLFLTFASWASTIALFQARLAHASYTAGPPLEWPESPAAEAITNLSSSPIP